MMATKEQERAALEKIRKIVDGVGGHDSYIGKAFEGCFAVAQENIDNDFWNSFHDKCASEHEKLTKCQLEFAAQKERMDRMEDQLDTANAMLGERNRMLDLKDHQMEECYNREADLIAKNEDLEEKNKALELEIMKLKAKLYDIMMAQ